VTSTERRGEGKKEKTVHPAALLLPSPYAVRRRPCKRKEKRFKGKEGEKRRKEGGRGQVVSLFSPLVFSPFTKKKASGKRKKRKGGRKKTKAR